jgi:hypothetical protein
VDRSAFAREVAALTLGKRMPDGVYVHVDALPSLPYEIRDAALAAQTLAKLDAEAFQVVKFGRGGWRLSLLYYPGFFEEPFPTLAASWAVDLGARSVTSRSYAAEGNPPILHRKECSCRRRTRAFRDFAELTEAAKRLGVVLVPALVLHVAHGAGRRHGRRA